MWWEYDPQKDQTVRAPHPDAGHTIERSAYPPNNTYGECDLAQDEVDNDPQFFTISEDSAYTVLMTDPSHGCLEFADAPEDWDHWNRELVKNKPRREDK